MGELTLHHLQISQSERIVWLLEELGLQYKLENHPRDPNTMLAPQIFRDLSSAGTGPAFVDTKVDPPVTIAESGAIAEYIANVYGNGRLTKKPGDTDYVNYLTWLHFSQGSLFPFISRIMAIIRTDPEFKHSGNQFALKRRDNALDMVNTRLKNSKYLAGEDLTLADIMTVFDLTTMRMFASYSLAPYPNILRYLKDVSQREAYQRAMKKGDPEMDPVLGEEITDEQKDILRKTCPKIFGEPKFSRM